MEALLDVSCFSNFNSTEPLLRRTPFRRDHHGHYSRERNPVVSVFRSSLPGEDAFRMFLNDRQLNGDFVSKASDVLCRRNGLMKFVDSEVTSTTIGDENLQQLQYLEEAMEGEIDGGFLKLTQTQEWISGDKTAPLNKKAASTELQDDSERRKRLNLLKYDAIKEEMIFFNCWNWNCMQWILFGSLFNPGCYQLRNRSYFQSSFLCLQLLYFHVDNLSREAVPQIFRQKKLKKIGIRSEDLESLIERTVNGSAIALSSPRIMIPAAIYGIWGLSSHFSSDLFSFQLVPAMLGLFAYKAAALVQVYRDNEDLRLIFPGDDENSYE